jgi:hypothetical protein
VKGELVTEYYHEGVACYLVGYDTPVPLDLEMIAPGEGEVTAAKRLLLRVLKKYPRYFDAIVADAAYLRASFVQFCGEHNVDLVAVLKKNQKSLLTDANALLGLVASTTWNRRDLSVRGWDMEGFKLGKAEIPLRVLHTEETLTKRERRNHKWHTRNETHQWWWATTIPASRLSTEDLWEAAHARWEIENDLFHNLATYWALDHSYRHEPTAIVNFILTLFLAFVLVQTFYYRNLKPCFREELPVIRLTIELHLGLNALGSRPVWAINLATAGP